MDKVRAHVFVEGRVQGVFFRAYTREEAVKYAVSGWVRNTDAGTVEAVFEGSREDVQALINWCHTGPPYASVVNVRVTWEPYAGDFSDFSIVY